MNKQTVAVFGISGVGKTYLISRFLLLNAGFLHVQASSLIKIGLQQPSVDSNTLRTATALKIADNQLALIGAFNATKSANPDRHIIFDGHSVIDNDSGLVDIDIAVIKALEPGLIAFVEDDVGAILERRRSDVGRKRPDRSVHELEAHQVRAKLVCTGYAEKLDVRMVSFNTNDIAGFASCVLSLTVASSEK